MNSKQSHELNLVIFGGRIIIANHVSGKCLAALTECLKIALDKQSIIKGKKNGY
jgi:hypothetical protein